MRLEELIPYILYKNGPINYNQIKKKAEQISDKVIHPQTFTKMIKSLLESKKIFRYPLNWDIKSNVKYYLEGQEDILEVLKEKRDQIISTEILDQAFAKLIREGSDIPEVDDVAFEVEMDPIDKTVHSEIFKRRAKIVKLLRFIKEDIDKSIVEPKILNRYSDGKINHDSVYDWIYNQIQSYDEIKNKLGKRIIVFDDSLVDSLIWLAVEKIKEKRVIQY
jgi:hypothetical protein